MSGSSDGKLGYHFAPVPNWVVDAWGRGEISFESLLLQVVLWRLSWRDARRANQPTPRLRRETLALLLHRGLDAKSLDSLSRFLRKQRAQGMLDFDAHRNAHGEYIYSFRLFADQPASIEAKSGPVDPERGLSLSGPSLSYLDGVLDLDRLEGGGMLPTSNGAQSRTGTAIACSVEGGTDEHRAGTLRPERRERGAERYDFNEGASADPEQAREPAERGTPPPDQVGRMPERAEPPDDGALPPMTAYLVRDLYAREKSVEDIATAMNVTPAQVIAAITRSEDSG